MPATAYQLELDFILGSYRPLIRVAEAQVLLHDCSDRHVLDLLDEGVLTGVDLAGRGQTKRLVRLWRHVVLHVALQPQKPVRTVPVEDLLPTRRETVLRTEVERWFQVSASTVAEWGLKGPRTDHRAIIYRRALVQFLDERAIA
jgi:hypothetical protein